jgi:protein-disulfide isomerase/uncharacterized membrane protein
MITGGLGLLVSLSGVIGSALVTIALGIVSGWLICTGLLLKDRSLGSLSASLFGVAISAYLVKQHLIALDGGESICNIDATFNCDLINTSRWSEIGGIPTAMFAFAFYAGTATVSYLGWRGGDKNTAATRVLWVAAWFATLFSAAMAVVSFQLGSWCLFCISLYVVALVLLSAAWIARTQGEDRWQGSTLGALTGRNGDNTVGTGAVVGLVCLIAGMALYQGQSAQTDRAIEAGDSTALAQFLEMPTGEIVLDGTEAIYGKADAPYQLVEWADFECPYCGQAARELKQMIDESPHIQLRFKHYPISGICNEYITGDRHEHACGAARSAECAGEQGLFWDLASKMFMNQNYLSTADIQFMAKQIGLNMDDFNACVTADRSLRAVRDDVVHAKRADVHGTPALFLKGTHGDQWVKISPEVRAITAIVGAHREGKALPEPKAAEPHAH